jgi:hypothetical protein
MADQTVTGRSSCHHTSCKEGIMNEQSHFIGQTIELFRDIDDYFAGLDEQASLDARVAVQLDKTVQFAASFLA